MACFTGRYPMDVPGELDKLALEAPAWARDRHDVDWVAHPASDPGREGPATSLPAAGSDEVVPTVSQNS